MDPFNDSPDDPQQAAFKKKMIRLAILEMPGTILVVLGLYGRYWSDDDAFLPFLNDHQTVNVILTLGIIIWLYCWVELTQLIRNKR